MGDVERFILDRTRWPVIPVGQVWHGPADVLFHPHPLPAYTWRCNIVDGCPWTGGVVARTAEQAARGAERHRRKYHPTAPLGAVQPAVVRHA